MGHFGARPIRMAWFALVLPALRAQLLRPGRAPARATRRRSTNPFFAMVPAGAPHLRARRPLERRDRDRVAGADLRRVLADAPGGAARLLPARHDPPHVAARPRGRSTSRRSTGCSRSRCIALVLDVPASRRRLGGGVRHRGHRHDGDHVDRLLRRDRARPGAGRALEGAAAARALPRFDLPFFACEPAQVLRRRLRAVADRRRILRS